MEMPGLGELCGFSFKNHRFLSRLATICHKKFNRQRRLSSRLATVMFYGTLCICFGELSWKLIGYHTFNPDRLIWIFNVDILNFLINPLSFFFYLCNFRILTFTTFIIDLLSFKNINNKNMNICKDWSRIWTRKQKIYSSRRLQHVWENKYKLLFLFSISQVKY